MMMHFNFKKIILVTIISSLNFCALFAQFTVTYLNVEEIIQLGKDVPYYRDQSEKETITQVLSSDKPFQPYKGDVLNFENSPDNIWLKFELHNSTHEKIYLQFGNPELDHIACYGVKNGELIWSEESGNQHPYGTRYLKSNRVCLPTYADSSTIYIRFNGRSSLYLPLYIGSLKSLSEINHKDDLFNGACIGVMLIMLFYNFFIFLSVRDKLYLQYCLYLLSSTIMMFFIEGLQFDLIWRNHHTINNFYFTNIIVACTTAFAIWFSTTFLNLKKNAPKLKWVNGFLLLGLALSVIFEQLGFQSLVNPMIQAFSGITSIYLLILGIVLLSRGLKEAKFYVVSWGILVSGAIIYILTLNGVIGINFLSLNSFQIGSMLEAVMLSFALADRINSYRKDKHIAQKMALEQAQENEKLIRDQNIFLEHEVEIRTRDLKAEMQKSEDLLLNILPYEVAQELKEQGASEARLYNHVTVLFTDFVNFTGIGQKLSPQHLVNEIHHYFEAFDNITIKYGLEKIKTIGDAYMAVCGMPIEDKNHAKNVALAALEIRDFIDAYRKEGGLFDIRIGIHSGPVVAGIVGIKKFAYDIWGDTVNTASRMESAGEIDQINISNFTHDLIKHEPEFTFIPRGKVEAKGKGEMEMWFINRA